MPQRAAPNIKQWSNIRYINLYKIWGFHSIVYSVFGLLGCEYRQSYCEQEHSAWTCFPRDLNSIKGTVTRPQAGRFGVQFPARAKDFSLPQIIKTSSEAHPVSYSMVIGVSSPRRQISCSMNLTTHQHLVLRLRKHGATTLLPLYAFMM